MYLDLSRDDTKDALTWLKETFIDFENATTAHIQFIAGHNKGARGFFNFSMTQLGEEKPFHGGIRSECKGEHYLNYKGNIIVPEDPEWEL